MALPYLEFQGLKYAPFNDTMLEPYGAFANTTETGKYPLSQKVEFDGTLKTFKWPSAAHAYHAQKIIYLKDNLPKNHVVIPTLKSILTDIAKMKNPVFLAQIDYDELIREKYFNLLSKNLVMVDEVELFKLQFDALCGVGYNSAVGIKLDFMRNVVRLKLEQYPKVADRAKECAKEGILPILVSEDLDWGLGFNGSGRNNLGIILLEEGIRLLELNHEEPTNMSPRDAYEWLQQANHNLSYANLVGHLDAKTWVDGTYHKKPQLKFSTDGANDFFLDKNTGITFVGQADRRYHFRDNNQQKIIIDEEYDTLMVTEVNRFMKLRRNHQAPHQPQPLKYKGVRGQDYCFLDKNTGITLVEQPNGIQFSQYGVEIEVSEGCKLEMQHQVLQMKNQLKSHYHHSNYQTKGRFHFFTATIGKHEELNKKHQALSGDALKTSLLLEFKYQLEQCKSSAELNEKYDEITNSVGYKNVLAKGQGVTTRLFDLKTSSVKALSKIKEELLSKYNEEKSEQSTSFGFSHSF